jgi:hypothetical protein
MEVLYMTKAYLGDNHWPDFPNRGIMLDISTNKVPTMETCAFIIFIILENKSITVIYRTYICLLATPEVWVDASPFTGRKYCCWMSSVNSDISSWC